jgi:dual specificity tyrosine-phosphorylation-regulated kinase 2/3/4
MKLVSKKGVHHIPGSKSLSTYLNADDADYIDFVSKCLEWDAARRLKPDDAICHKWIVSS